jgi:outer membrane lipoprotein-sorting protein
MHGKWKSSALIVFFILSIASIAQAVNLKSIQQRYSHIEDFTASFSQETFQMIANKSVHFTGTVSYKRNSGVRMDVLTPQRQILVLRGRNALIILPEEGTSQVQEIPKEIAAQNILGFFTGLGSIEEYYSVQETNENIILKPKEGAGSITVWTDKDNLIRRILLKDATGNASDISLSRYRFSQGLNDKLFKPEAIGGTTKSN